MTGAVSSRPLPRVPLGESTLHVPPLCLGTMTFGQQVDEPLAHAILDEAVDAGVDFIDTAEMYPIPASAATYGSTETIVGNWMASRRSRQRIVLATKVAGFSRGMPWIRPGPDMTPEDIVASCEGSLRRLRCETIDLYQIHWPERSVPIFGQLAYDPSTERSKTTLHEQLEALGRLVAQGKVRHVGLANETPYGVHEFVRLAEQHGLPRVASVQNHYSLLSRAVENGLDETMHRLGVSLLAYSPLTFGLLSGKYDQTGTAAGAAPAASRFAEFESVRRQRGGRPEALEAARRYNRIARENGMTPAQMALAWCFTQWRVTSTIIGVTSPAQLRLNLAAWGTELSAEVREAIDQVRWEIRDPAF